VLRGSQGITAEVDRIDRLRKAEADLRKAPTGAHHASRGHILAEPESCPDCGRWHSPEKHAEHNRLAQEAFDRADEEDARREAGRQQMVTSPDKPRDLEEKGYKKILRDLLREIQHADYAPDDQVQVSDMQPTQLAGSASGQDETILPAGQPDVPGPLEMVDPCSADAVKAQMEPRMEARRNPGINLPGPPHEMQVPDPVTSTHHLPGRPVPVSEQNRLTGDLP
jgi:hypothetical protein